ncbi:hypothetical protein ACIBCB_10260 [Streptomyces uncialis]|uniref:hypothetical protein n=1 Tax=Streptomyces uncialis TaxID=1048205 RepID=UPI0037BA45E2
MSILEAGEVVAPDGVEPLRQPFTLALGEHLGEGADVSGEGVEFELLRLGSRLCWI